MYYIYYIYIYDIYINNTMAPKKLIAPEQKAKQNMAKNLFGGPKGSTAASHKPSPAPMKGPEPKKKVEKV